MIDAFAKAYLHNNLRDVRAAMLWKLEGLTEYDARRPLTATGTNLLGLVKHLSNTEARYFGDVFGRPFPERLPWWGDDDFEPFADMWATADEPRADIVDRYRRVCEHSDATITALDIDAPGHVPWWPRPDVKLFNVMIHVLSETSRHAGLTSCASSWTELSARKQRTRSCKRSTRSSGQSTAPGSSKQPGAPIQLARVSRRLQGLRRRAHGAPTELDVTDGLPSAEARHRDELGVRPTSPNKTNKTVGEQCTNVVRGER